jgi:hypothetical protein
MDQRVGVLLFNSGARGYAKRGRGGSKALMDLDDGGDETVQNKCLDGTGAEETRGQKALLHSIRQTIISTEGPKVSRQLAERIRQDGANRSIMQVWRRGIEI